MTRKTFVIRLFVMMKYGVILFVFVFATGVICVPRYGEAKQRSIRVRCPANEYNPGRDCGLEPSCAGRSATAHPKTTCDCWCQPGLRRELDTNTCVEKC